MFHVTIVFVSGVCKVRRMSTLVGGHKPAHSHSQVLGDSESEALRTFVRISLILWVRPRSSLDVGIPFVGETSRDCTHQAWTGVIDS